MGWNGGGFGHMTFENGDGVAAWKAANVSHDQWTDWADWFEKPVAPKFVVRDQLASLRELHDPKGSGYFVIDEQGPTIDVAFDTGEDTVRDFSGTIAATLRSAAEHGARGTFYFLGTAGAEYDFTYKLEIANGHSTMETLGEHEIAQVYEGDQYQAFLARVMEALGVTADGEIVDDAGAMPVVEAGADGGDAEREALKKQAAAFNALEAKPSEEADKPAAKATAATKAAKPAAKNTAKPAKAAAKKPAVKKAAKPAVKKAAAKPAAKKAAAKPAAKKAAAKPAAKKPAAKKPGKKK